MASYRNIFRNMSMLFTAQLFTLVLSFLYITIAARYLGPAHFGVLSFALAFTGIFGAAANIGLRKIQVRDLARDRSLIPDYFSKITSLKMLLSIVLLAAIVFLVNIMGYPKLTKDVVYVLGIAFVSEAILQNLYAVFQSVEDMRLESATQVVRAAMLLSGAALAITTKQGVIFFSYVYLISSLAILFICIRAYSNRFSLPALALDKGFFKGKFREAAPFGLIGIFEMVYHWIDTVMLSLMKGDIVVGWYGVAYRIFLTTLYVPSVVSVVIFPVMSRLHTASDDSLKTVYTKYFKYMTAAGCLIALELAMFSDKAVLMVFGKGYEQSAAALRILMISLVLISVNGAFVRLLEATDRQRILMKICGGAAGLNILLNLLLIPKFSYIGASVATVFSEIFITVSVIYIVSGARQRLEGHVIGSHLIKVSASALASGICALILMGNAGPVLIFVLSTAVYIGMFSLLKGFDGNDLTYLKGLLRKENLAVSYRGADAGSSGKGGTDR